MEQKKRKKTENEDEFEFKEEDYLVKSIPKNKKKIEKKTEKKTEKKNVKKIKKTEKKAEFENIKIDPNEEQLFNEMLEKVSEMKNLTVNFFILTLDFSKKKSLLWIKKMEEMGVLKPIKEGVSWEVISAHFLPRRSSRLMSLHNNKPSSPTQMEDTIPPLSSPVIY